jgi:transposase-like protein
MTNDEGLKPVGAPERSPKAGVGAPSGVDGNGPKRFSVQRKMAIVARLLRGEPLHLVARQTNVSIARLTKWRDRALAGAATALKERERDDRDELARDLLKFQPPARFLLVGAGHNPNVVNYAIRCLRHQNRELPASWPVILEFIHCKRSDASWCTKQSIKRPLSC